MIDKIEALNLSPLRTAVTWIMFVSVMMLAGTYLFFVNAAVLKVVSWNRIQKSISVSNANRASLESDFASLRASLSLEKAVEFGFREVINPVFVTRQSLRQDLTITYLQSNR